MTSNAMTDFNSPSRNANNSHDQSQEDPAVVASAKPSGHPYSSLALSPNRNYACCAAKDALHIFRIGPSGLRAVKIVPMAQHFSSQTAAAASSSDNVTARQRMMGHGRSNSNNNNNNNNQDSSQQHQSPGILDAFLGPSSKQAATAMPMNVTVTSVAWSPNWNQNDSEQQQEKDAEKSRSFIAAAGSNGVIVVFSASSLLEADSNPLVEVILSEHVRAVNGLDWHPHLPGLLLSASQDGTVLLWEREQVEEETAKQLSHHAPSFSKFFGNMHRANAPKQRYSWKRRSKFEPKSEAVRDISWNPFLSDVFCLVTTSGSLIAYNRHVTIRALVKLTAHAGDATSLDWHPLRKHVVATGGANDRTVKIWNLEAYLNVMSKTSDDAYATINGFSMASRADSTNSNDDSNSEHAAMMERDQKYQSAFTLGSASSSSTTVPWHLRSSSPGSTYNAMHSLNHHSSSRHSVKGPATKALLQALTVSASVTRIKWRPPALSVQQQHKDTSEFDAALDHHVGMLAVATAPIKGASAGGSGMLALWTCDRPYVPLRIVQGHDEGAVNGFEWLETPQQHDSTKNDKKHVAFGLSTSPNRVQPVTAVVGRSRRATEAIGGGRFYGTSSSNDTDILFDNGDNLDDAKTSRIWQHVISVGRDGRCLIQSFVRGDDLVSRIPPSCFAMANLSPFQKGYGSLQIFSVSQALPSGSDAAFSLTGLRRDSATNAAPGIYREPALDTKDSLDVNLITPRKVYPSAPLELVFNIVDQGNLDDESKPVEEQKQIITVVPEVVHLSRFASRYVLYPNEKIHTRVDLCLHNGFVAESLKCGHLAHMWRMVASMLDSCGNDSLPDSTTCGPNNVMEFVILPTLKSLLEERAEDGDVQTCVALCELLQLVTSESTVRLPGLSISLVREWYLSYIDLLKDMCLFSHASYLIRSCNDPFIGALNQQSTTIHESCPNCGKPLQPSDTFVAGCDDDNVRRVCRSCRKRVGLCFLCHEPVKGMYVWCPGCGHGGHLDHALQWFGGQQDRAVRGACPTGCGHRCNLLQQISAFPRSSSMKELPSTNSLDQLGEFAIGFVQQV
ncbi:hypothetical protein MPSEU_000196700 [Mayamaea pseudoterrestris]|nr:hypothetical protein MPSEU_000196700 [Mayamaea pseudoterrestris]